MNAGERQNPMHELLQRVESNYTIFSQLIKQDVVDINAIVQQRTNKWQVRRGRVWIMKGVKMLIAQVKYIFRIPHAFSPPFTTAKNTVSKPTTFHCTSN